jgi:GTP-binding nuclear protein Ran
MTTIRYVAFIGDGGVGKTTYLERLTEGTFQQRYVSTIGSREYYITGNEMGEEGMLDTNCSFHIIDTAGQEKYGGLGLRVIERDIDTYMIFFDLTSKLSFKNCVTWLNKVRAHKTDASIILVATKLDVLERKVSQSSINRFLTKWGIPICIYISSKSCYNYDKPFLYIDK